MHAYLILSVGLVMYGEWIVESGPLVLPIGGSPLRYHTSGPLALELLGPDGLA